MDRQLRQQSLVTENNNKKYSDTNFTKQTTDEEIIRNLKQQIQILSVEKSSIEELWRTSQKTITNLETALNHYYKHFNDNQPSLDEVTTTNL